MPAKKESGRPKAVAPTIEYVYIVPFDSSMIRVNGKNVSEDNHITAKDAAEAIAEALGIKFISTDAEKVPRDSNAWYDGVDEDYQ